MLPSDAMELKINASNSSSSSTSKTKGFQGKETSSNLPDLDSDLFENTWKMRDALIRMCWFGLVTGLTLLSFAISLKFNIMGMVIGIAQTFISGLILIKHHKYQKKVKKNG